MKQGFVFVSYFKKIKKSKNTLCLQTCLNDLGPKDAHCTTPKAIWYFLPSIVLPSIPGVLKRPGYTGKGSIFGPFTDKTGKKKNEPAKPRESVREASRSPVARNTPQIEADASASCHTQSSAEAEASLAHDLRGFSCTANPATATPQSVKRGTARIGGEHNGTLKLGVRITGEQVSRLRNDVAAGRDGRGLERPASG